MRSKRSSKIREFLCLLLAMILLLCGCSSPLGEAVVDGVMDGSSGNAAETAEEDGSEKGMELTSTAEAEGVSEESPEIPRPYAFMLDNMSVASPQCGIAAADIIFEFPDEGSVTKMMALITDPEEQDMIGPIRTARNCSVELALGYDAILVHASASETTEKLIEQYGLAELDASNNAFDSGAFYLAPSRQDHGSDHGLFADGAGCVSSAEGLLTYRTVMREGSDSTYDLPRVERPEDQCDLEASKVTMIFAGGKVSSFEYDAAQNGYSMYQFGEVYADNGETPVVFANVIAIYVPTYSQEGSSEPVMELTEGTGWYFTGGKGIEIRWYKDGAYDVLHFEMLDHTSLKLAEGTTYVGLIPCGGYKGTVTLE